MTRVAVLTPPGMGAIATLAIVGPGAWEAVRSRFRPAGGKSLPESPAPHRFWFGTLGAGAGDEVVVAVREVEPEPWVEVHCHGGRRVVRWLVEQFVAAGCPEVGWQELIGKPTHDRGWAFNERALEPLTRATTLRAAAVLLDQYHGAFARAIGDVCALLDCGDGESAMAALRELAAFAPVGRHLVQPWRVVVAGPPNVGKSSLINALAGYQRSVVAPVAGTTRDVVTVTVALDGWPVELADTAGLRVSAEELEAAGVARARRRLAEADLVVWVADLTEPRPAWPTSDLGRLRQPPLLVANKSDQPAAWAFGGDVLPVSAVTGEGVPGLAARIVGRLVPVPPPPGAAVPFTPALADAIEQAGAALTAGAPGPARLLLATCLSAPSGG